MFSHILVSFFWLSTSQGEFRLGASSLQLFSDFLHLWWTLGRGIYPGVPHRLSGELLLSLNSIDAHSDSALWRTISEEPVILPVVLYVMILSFAFLFQQLLYSFSNESDILLGNISLFLMDY